jgi:predicted transcriptional regulator
MMKELDELDKALLDRINENQGYSIRDVIRPFLLEKSESALRERIRALELRQLIKTKQTKREVECYPVGMIEPGAEEVI